MPRPSSSAAGLRWLVLAGMLAITLQLRAPITSVPPALDRISATLHLTPTVAGLVTSLPLVCFGVFAFVTPVLAARVGLEPTLWASAVLMMLGMAVRHDAHALTFFAGTLVLGMGIALGNVILPALARSWFPDRLPLVMGVYTVVIQVSGAAGPFLAAPLLARGWAWPTTISVWVWPGLVALVGWTLISVRVARSRRGEPHHGAPPAGLLAVARRPRSWAITFVMGTQSLLFFALLTWLPVQLRGHGLDEATLGVVLGVYSILGLPGSFWAADLGRGTGAPGRLAVLTTAYVVGFALLPTTLVGCLVGVLICGVCQGLWLVVALTFIADQAEPGDVPAVSALAQGAGYLWSSLGPVAVGAAYAATGTLVAGEALLGVLAALLGLAAVALARRGVRGSAAAR
ncbi:MFS transporter [Mariniluteicoccus flavus]